MHVPLVTQQLWCLVPVALLLTTRLSYLPDSQPEAAPLTTRMFLFLRDLTFSVCLLSPVSVSSPGELAYCGLSMSPSTGCGQEPSEHGWVGGAQAPRGSLLSCG